MPTKVRDRDYYIERIKSHLLRKYPGMRFEIEHFGEKETFIYCYPVVPTEDTYDITHRAANIATDALVDAGYRIYVMAG